MSTRQTFGIEYEVVDLEGDLDGAPLGLAEPRRLIDEEIAMLSGGLFDRLPKVEVPLDTFFPQTLEPSYWSRPRTDSLPPLEACVPEAAPSLRSGPGPGWFVGMTAAAVIAMAVAVIAQRPQIQPIVLQPATAAHALPQATPQPARPAPVVAPVETGKVASGTGPVRAAKSVRATPVVAAVSSVPVAEPESMPVQSAPAPAAAPPAGPPQSSAAVAIAAAGRGASGCFEPDELRRTMAVSVTFAPSGHATRAVIEGGPHRATAVGSCIAQRLRNAVVAPFDGPPVTIHTSVHLR
jgi:hypothetical protein